MQRAFIAFAATLVALPLAAQDHFTTSPNGYENIEGNSSLDLIGKQPLLRFQQINSLQAGALANRNRIAFRRDGLLADNAAYGARTIELELTMSEANFAVAGSDFAANMTGNTMVVIARKQVSLPDWTFAPAVAPTPSSQNAILGFDSGAIWSYAGQSTGPDYLFDIKVYSNDQAGTGYPMDADSFVQTFSASISHTLTNGGCIATGETSAMQNHFNVYNYGTRFDYDADIKNGVAGAPAVLFLGAAPASPLMLPGACDEIYVNPATALQAAVVTLDPNGQWLGAGSLLHNAALVGAQFSTQGVTVDTAQKFSLAFSYGRDHTIGVDPTNAVGVKHLFALDPTATQATSGLVDGGVVLWTNHP